MAGCTESGRPTPPGRRAEGGREEGPGPASGLCLHLVPPRVCSGWAGVSPLCPPRAQPGGNHCSGHSSTGALLDWGSFPRKPGPGGLAPPGDSEDQAAPGRTRTQEPHEELHQGVERTRQSGGVGSVARDTRPASAPHQATSHGSPRPTAPPVPARPGKEPQPLRLLLGAPTTCRARSRSWHAIPGDAEAGAAPQLLAGNGHQPRWAGPRGGRYIGRQERRRLLPPSTPPDNRGVTLPPQNFPQSLPSYCRSVPEFNQSLRLPSRRILAPLTSGSSCPCGEPRVRQELRPLPRPAALRTRSLGSW